MEAAAKIILDYWFGGLKDGWTADDRLALWFGSRAEDDEDMRRRFGALIDEAVAGRLDSWSNDDGGGLALILLTDQMTRSTRRGTRAAFAGDPVALATAERGLAEGRDQNLPAVYRLFYYLPLEHCEDIDRQRQSLRRYRRLYEDFPEHQPSLQLAIEESQRHHDMIERFGRFPHRNAILGRENTPEEEAYLKRHPGNYGQTPRS